MSEPRVFSHEAKSLSEAWSVAFLDLMQPPRHELSPFLVSIKMGADGKPIESATLRNALDNCLLERGFLGVEKIAKSIFPLALWNRANGDRQQFFEKYKELLPDYVAMEPQKNKCGIYFGRLIGFGLNHKTGAEMPHLPSSSLEAGGNQLEFIINALKPKAQRMALQACVYDPVRDQTAARHSFPCLQHITFVPDFDRMTLSLNAFYALQSLFVKGYGNWLGLCRLGEFVATQASPKLRFDRLNCYAGIQRMSADTEPNEGPLLEQLRREARSCAGTLRREAVGAKV